MTETTTTSEHGVGQDTDHHPVRHDRPSEAQPRPASRLLNLFGWVMGGLSLVNLVHDLTPLDLYGRLLEWMQAYKRAVAALAKPLFGWIHWRWISIDSIDAHILVITIMLTAAVARASTEVQIADGRERAGAMMGAWQAAFLVVFLPVLIVLSLVPRPFDAAFGATALITVAVFFGFVFKKQDRAVPPAHIVRREVVGVLSVAALIVALNYALFHG